MGDDNFLAVAKEWNQAIAQLSPLTFIQEATYRQVFPLGHGSDVWTVAKPTSDSIETWDPQHTWKYVYSRSSSTAPYHLTQKVSADGRDGFTATYDTNGLPSQVTDVSGRVTWQFTNVSGNTTQVVATDGNQSQTWSYVYTGQNLTSISVNNSTYRTFAYNASGLLTEMRDASGNVLESHDYYSDGNAKTSLEAASGDEQYTYYGPDANGVSHTDISFLDASGSTTGATRRVYMRFIGGRMRVVENDGVCACGTDDSVFGFDSKGNLIRQQSGRGYIVEQSFDTQGRLTARTTAMKKSGCDPETASDHCRLTYDQISTAQLQPSSASVTTTYTYGDANFPRRATVISTPSVLSAGNFTTVTTAFTAAGNVSSKTVSGYTGTPTASLATHVTTNAYYNGVETAAFDPGTFFASYYSLPQPLNALKSVDGPRTDVSDVTLFVYYPITTSVPVSARGRLAATRNAAGHIIRYENYDLTGLPLKVTDANSVVTTFTRDALGRVLTTTVAGVTGCDTSVDPLCATALTETRAYNNILGSLASVVSPRGDATVYSYDSRGRIVSTLRGTSTADADLFEKIEIVYDSSSGKKSEENVYDRASGVWTLRKTTKFDYYADRRLHRTYQPPFQTPLTAGDFDESAYDADGNLSAVKDARHSSFNTSYSYDPMNRVSRVKRLRDAVAYVWTNTSYGYDAAGNLTSVTDPNGNVTTYTTDDFGQNVRTVSPVTGTTAKTYDAAGNATTTTDARGASTTRTYDALNRVINSTSSLSGSEESTAYSYDSTAAGVFGVGRLTNVTDAPGTVALSYTRTGRLRLEARNTSRITAYQYDADGNRTRITYPSGRVVTYSYDFAGRPITASGSLAGVTHAYATSASYEPFGPMTSLTLGNGLVQSFTYDSRYRMLTNVLLNGTTATASYSYSYDGAGNILTLNDALASGYNRTFAYDDLGRLTTANSGTALWGTGAMSYDAMGNMTAYALGANTRSFSYSGSSPQNSAMTYDSAGNELFGLQTGLRDYSPRGLLSHVHFPEDGDVVIIGGGGLNSPSTGAADGGGMPCDDCPDSSDTFYLYDYRGVRTHADHGGVQNGFTEVQVAVDYDYLPELALLSTQDASGARDFIWFGARPLADESYRGLRYTTADHLATPFLQTDASKTVVWRAEYSPFGEIYATRNGQAADQPLRFPGQDISLHLDGENYNVFRWYRSGWGRYTQSDPIGLAGGNNVYRYASDDPIGVTDALGLISDEEVHSMTCCELSAEIARALRELRRLRNNEQKENWRKQSAGVMAVEYVNHIIQYWGWQVRLIKLLAAFDKNCMGPINPAARDLSTAPYPDFPSDPFWQKWHDQVMEALQADSPPRAIPWFPGTSGEVPMEFAF